MDCGGYSLRVEAVINVNQEIDFRQFSGMCFAKSLEESANLEMLAAIGMFESALYLGLMGTWNSFISSTPVLISLTEPSTLLLFRVS